ncbi:MAG: hypothetical protein ACOCYQ_07995 [Alkalispirochaeta sp.]
MHLPDRFGITVGGEEDDRQTVVGEDYSLGVSDAALTGEAIDAGDTSYYDFTVCRIKTR